MDHPFIFTFIALVIIGAGCALIDFINNDPHVY